MCAACSGVLNRLLHLQLLLILTLLCVARSLAASNAVEARRYQRKLKLAFYKFDSGMIGTLSVSLVVMSLTRLCADVAATLGTPSIAIDSILSCIASQRFAYVAPDGTVTLTVSVCFWSCVLTLTVKPDSSTFWTDGSCATTLRCSPESGVILLTHAFLS